MSVGCQYTIDPNTWKVSMDESNDKLVIGASTVQGRRYVHEDAHTCLLNFDVNTSLFAVFDGHISNAVADYCASELPEYIKQTEAYQNKNFEKALIDAFLGFDATINTPEVIEVLKRISEPIDNMTAWEINLDLPEAEQKNVEGMRAITDEDCLKAGCTAVVALLHDDQLFVANVGDSRCIVCRNGQAIEMSIDHKPDVEEEYVRITRAGGSAEYGRIRNGGPSLSRAIGDHYYKQNKDLSDREQMITALPDVRKLSINPGEDEFMVLACDGIWELMTSQQVVDFIRPKIQENEEKLSKICEEMFELCVCRDIEPTLPKSLAIEMLKHGVHNIYRLFFLGCDSMTAIIVKFKANQESEELKHAKIYDGLLQTETVI